MNFSGGSVGRVFSVLQRSVVSSGNTASRNLRSRTCSAARTRPWTCRSISRAARRWRAADRTAGGVGSPAARSLPLPGGSPGAFANSASASVDRGPIGRIAAADHERRASGMPLPPGCARTRRAPMPRRVSASSPLLLVNDGTSACSTTRWRGRTSDAISASPNRSSRLQMLRSIGSCHTRARAIEIAAHEHAVDPGVDRGGVECHEAALAIADHTDLAAVPASVRKPSTAASTFWTSYPIGWRPMWNACRYSHSRQVCWLLRSCVSLGLDGFATDQRGNEQFAPALREAAGELPFGRQAWREAHDLLGSLAGIGHHHQMRGGRAVRRLHEQPFGRSRRPGRATAPGRHGSGSSRRRVRGCPRRRTARRPGGSRGSTTPMISRKRSRLPSSAAFQAAAEDASYVQNRADRAWTLVDLPVDEPMRAVHHSAREIVLGPVECRSLR